jgi:hypothetical protein
MSETPMLSLGMLNDGVANSEKIKEAGIGIILHNIPLNISGSP